MARQGVAQYTATQGQTGPFLCPFYVYDVSYLSVYLTPVGNPPNDTADLLNSSQYTGTNSSVPDSSYITLNTPANAGDLITIFYEFANATVIPQYPYCSTVDSAADGILPVLPPDSIWIKSSDGSKITTTVIPGLVPNIPSVSGSPVTNSIVKFASASTSPITIKNSNTTLTSIRLASGNYYDNVAGINNLSMAGSLTVGDVGSDVIGYKLAVAGSAIASSFEAAFSLVLDDLSNINKTYITSPVQYNSNITYTLPESQANIPASLLVNDANGNLSWLPQSAISEVGVITQGSWSADNVAISNGTVAASTGVFSTSKQFYSGEPYSTSWISTDALIIEDSSITPNSTTIASPVGFGGNYIYVLPATIGTTGQVLKIQNTNTSSGVSVASLNWSTPVTIPPATPSQVDFESQTGVYIDPTTLHYHRGIAKAWIRFHAVTNSDSTVDPIISSYYFAGGVPSIPIVRLSIGVYEINFHDNFTTGLTYSIVGTGFYTSSEGLITVAQYAADNTGHGEDPQPGSCRIAILDKNGNLTDAATPSGYPNPPDISVAFFGY